MGKELEKDHAKILKKRFAVYFYFVYLSILSERIFGCHVFSMATEPRRGHRIRIIGNWGYRVQRHDVDAGNRTWVAARAASVFNC